MPGFDIRLSLQDERATDALGAALARGLQAGDAVLLSGPLGAGKTALARAMLRACGVEGPVPSPTFTLVQLYETPALVIRHFDLYRIEDPADLAELGLEEALDEGAALVEWPEHGFPGRLAGEALRITLSPEGAGRAAHISGPARWRDTIGFLA